MLFRDLAVKSNPILPVRKRYLKRYKDQRENSRRKCPSDEEVTILINSIMDPRDKAIATLLAKTGIRRAELIKLDTIDIDWKNQSVRLKSTPKRTNCIVYFDDECARILRNWLRIRKELDIKHGCKALFINPRGGRLMRNGMYSAIRKWAEKILKWRNQGLDVYAYFNNDALGYAIENAQTLKKLCSKKRSRAIC